MVYSSFFIDTDDDRELKKQAEFVQKQSKQEERDTKKEIEQEVEEEIEQEVEEESNNDSEECEEVVSAIELSKVKVSSSIKLQTSNKSVKCFLFDLTKKDDFLN
jgi:sRNA-binding protein